MLVLLPPSETKNDPRTLLSGAAQPTTDEAGERLPLVATVSAADAQTAAAPSSHAATTNAQLVFAARETAHTEILAALQHHSAAAYSAVTGSAVTGSAVTGSAVTGSAKTGNATPAAAGSAVLKTLKLSPGPKAITALAANLELTTAPRLAAIELYTGVLYDALGYDTMAPSQQQWIATHVAIQSALYGLVAANELLALYRLSAGSSLPQLGSSLKKRWADVYAEYPWDEHGFVLDLRSNDYAALAPLPPTANTLKPFFAVRQEDGTLKTLNHFNKAGKGKLVRLLAQSQPQLRSGAEFTVWAATQGIEVEQRGNRTTLVLPN